VGYKLLSFLDAYFEFNQIRPGEDKIAFMIEGANFCYMVRPFDLKNVSTAYQCLMDKVLKDVTRTPWKFMLTVW